MAVSRKHVEWIPGVVVHAGCVPGGHPAPEPSCNCGISGAHDLNTLRNWGLCVAPGPLVVGEVELWGRLVPDLYGWRAEYARQQASFAERAAPLRARLIELCELLEVWAP